MPEKADLREKGWLKISSLAEKTGVSISTIHYYVQEGLLTPPVRTSRNMAYYDPVCIREIQTIQELRNTRFLPLSVIRQLIQAEREGQREEHVDEMRSLFTRIFHPLTDRDNFLLLSRAELLERTALPESSLKELEDNGLVSPQVDEEKSVYDDVDLGVALLFVKLRDFGVTPEDLRFFRRYNEYLTLEASRLHDLFHTFPDHDRVSLLEIFQVIHDLKEKLSVRIYRREIQRIHPQGFGTGGMKNEDTPASPES